VTAQTVFTFAAYNLTRLMTLLQWRYSTAQAPLCLKSAKRRK